MFLLKDGNVPFYIIVCSFFTTIACMNKSPIIIVHGGAGDIPNSRIEGKLNGIKVAVKAGHEILEKGGTALEAVEAAVMSMENDEYFNAGYGSVLNIRGEVAMEASIMRGSDLNVGAVTLVKEFANPISIARKVLTDSPHALLGGEGVDIFAIKKGFRKIDPQSLITQYSKDALEEFKQNGQYGKYDNSTREDVKGGVGTVGAVAVDQYGHVAAATSTGGITGKAVGRIGDTPQIGSGTYADDLIGGVSTTGHGESILKYCLAHTIMKLMENGFDANSATRIAVEGMTARLNNTAGVISLSKTGDVGVHFSSKQMAWSYIKEDTLFYGIEHGQVIEEQFKDRI